MTIIQSRGRAANQNPKSPGRWGDFLFKAAAASLVFLAISPACGLAQTVAAPQLDSATLHSRLATTMNPPGRPMPKDAADLDSMLRTKDFSRLTTRLRSATDAEDVDLDMNWEQTQIYNGAGFGVTYVYMFDLWRLGSALPAPKDDEMKQSAAMMLIYNLDLIALDGSKCADVSAPGHRRDQLFAQNPGLISYIRTLPRATRMTLGTVSLAIETATANLRQNDDVLCSGGMAQITQGLEAQGAKPLQQVPNAPGTVGKTYAVPPAPGYKPQFVAADVWGPKQIATRKAMPATLTHVLTIPGDNPAPTPGK